MTEKKLNWAQRRDLIVGYKRKRQLQEIIDLLNEYKDILTEEEKEILRRAEIVAQGGMSKNEFFDKIIFM